MLCGALGYVITRCHSKTVVTTAKAAQWPGFQVNSNGNATVAFLMLFLHSSELQVDWRDAILHAASSMWPPSITERDCTVTKQFAGHLCSCKNLMLLYIISYLCSVIQPSKLISCIKLDVSAVIHCLPLLSI